MAEIKNAIMFDPQKEREAKRKRAIAELLIQKGNMPQKNEQAGGMTVARSPWENINQAAQNYMGQYQLEGADNQMAEAEKRRQEMIREALSNQDPMQAAQILAQDPNTSDAAIKMYSDVLSDQRRMEQLKTVGARGNTPAAIQIANDIQDAIARGDYDRANMLYEIGKYQDKGMQRFGMPQGVNQPFIPQQGIPQGMQQVQGQDPLQEHLNAVMQQQQQMGTSPMQRPQLQPQRIPGYFEELSGGRAQIKGAETEAALQQDLRYKPQIKSAEARAQEVGKVAGERETRFTEGAARVPQLQNMVGRLQRLGDKATYTMAGRAGDVVRRELGMEMPEAAVARAEYISMVDNEILPLLRQTFGAQFTQKEGERLVATLGDPNASPQEKDARLKSFIRTKMEEVNTQARMSGIQEPYDQRSIDSFVSGIGQQQAPQQGREQIIEKLRANGVPEERIMQYIQAKGL